MVSEYIYALTSYGIRTGLVPDCEKNYTINSLLDVMGEFEYTEPVDSEKKKLDNIELEDILEVLINEAVNKKIIEDTITYRDIFDTKLMNCLVPRPVQVQEKFNALYKESPQKATDWFYKFSQDTNYIRRYRVKKDKKWTYESKYGTLDITINLSKPEKDPKAIAAACKTKSSSYPKCQLCMENEGYAGRMNHPARNNHRIIPVEICDKNWGFQYSPYVYYNEHCILFNGQHIPMKVDREAFCKLFDFERQFPHYMIGSNADLPIVGGSILSHDHFQGGKYTFAMEKAPVEIKLSIKGYEDVTAGIVKWPLSVIRISHKNPERLIDLAVHILDSWRTYTDKEAFIYAQTEGENHNTITPIARRKGELYELDLALRNNITTKEHPMGLYHPHEKLHHIKKENIGLIEVMGLAILPSRLDKEMKLMKEYILEKKNLNDNETLLKHAEWAYEFIDQYEKKGILITEDNIDGIVEKEIGKVFEQVLEDAGVYKCCEDGRKAFLRFIDQL